MSPELCVPDFCCRRLGDVLSFADATWSEWLSLKNRWVVLRFILPSSLTAEMSA